PAMYRNAVSDTFSDTFADPAVIQAKDGWWYAYSTADPLYSGDEPGVMHIARTKDWSDWEYLGTVFDQDNRPAFAEPTSGLWAPDGRYLDGRYVLYYSVTDTTLHAGGGDSAIGMATAPTPTGPWQPVDEPVVAPRPDSGPEGDTWETTIDPAHFTAVDGTRYLYWGSYGSGLWVTELSRDGTVTVGEPTMVATDNRYEGSFVVRHGGWYYLMASSANCCAGPSTGYSVLAGRSKSPTGPFVDAAGDAMTDPWVGGQLVLSQNGNRFIGAGHHAVATDAAGRDFIVYHAQDRNEPWLSEPFGINRRPMLIDRLDWIDGWPVTRAGAGPSDADLPAPVVGSDLGITADDPAAGGVAGLVPGPEDPRPARPLGSAGSPTPPPTHPRTGCTWAWTSGPTVASRSPSETCRTPPRWTSTPGPAS
ncbi:MAG: family 43 glycosylhydrolase, partial [Propionibacteriaceae bacterium]